MFIFVCFPYIYTCLFIIICLGCITMLLYPFQFVCVYVFLQSMLVSKSVFVSKFIFIYASTCVCAYVYFYVYLYIQVCVCVCVLKVLHFQFINFYINIHHDIITWEMLLPNILYIKLFTNSTF